MSNCVKIDNPVLAFKQGEIDGVRFMNDLRDHLGHDPIKREPKHMDDDIYKLCYCANWFLTPGQNIHVSSDCSFISIELGHGKSAHTERDLNQTMAVIARYVLVEKIFNLDVRNEFDSFKTTLTVSFRMMPGKLVSKGLG